LREAFIATEREDPEEWRDVAALANADLWLTAKETREVTPPSPPSSSPTGTEPAPTAPTARVACGS
jgi:hypothetical protein